MRKNVVQSGFIRDNRYVVEFLPESSSFNAGVMRWIGTKDVKKLNVLYFDNLESAERFLTQEGIPFNVLGDECSIARKKKVYSDNFINKK